MAIKLTIPANKLHAGSQVLELSENLMVMIGENGCGKSAILEQVFQQYLSDPKKQVICFTSGMNESYSPIFQSFVKKNKRFLFDYKNQEIDSAFDSFHFNKAWGKALIFFATALKSEGRVRRFLKESRYSIISDDGLNDDISSIFKFNLRISADYIKTIRQALFHEERVPDTPSIRRTVFHRLLTYVAEKFINEDYNFEKSVRWTSIEVKAHQVFNVFNGAKEKELFTFLTLASKDKLFIDLDKWELYLNGRNIDDLSDGEFQLLMVNAILDLFDSPDTIFLLDEIDSHLHYQNVQKLWQNLKGIQGIVLTTTHSADSIVCNSPEVIKLVDKGRLEAQTTAVEIFNRLQSLSENDIYSYRLMAKLPFIALVENKFDWFVFQELCKIKIGVAETEQVFSQVCAVPRSSNYDKTAQVFGKAKIDWCKKLFDYAPGNITTKHIFLICDKDAMRVEEIGSNCLVQNPHRQKMVELIDNQNNSNKLSLLSWKRREIENYLLCETMLHNHGKLNKIKPLIPRSCHSSLSNGNNMGITELDVKALLQSLYLKDGYTTLGTHEEGVDYTKLKNIISEIPATEISHDIAAMFNFIKGKIQAAR